MPDVKEKVFIVTGASAGIGAALVRSLAKEGCSLVMIARRKERLEALAAELNHLPGERLFLPGDIRLPATSQEAVALALAHFGRLDVIVNNAGVGQRSLLSKAPVEDLEAVWETNVMGPLHLIQAALPPMKERGNGHIVNISSIVSQRPMLLSGMYNATKTALNFLSRSLRMELLGEEIVVSLVYVGLTNTEFPEARLGPNGGSFLNLRGVPPAKVARTVLKAVKRRRQEVYVSWYDWVFVHANRLFPRTMDFFFARFGNYSTD